MINPPITITLLVVVLLVLLLLVADTAAVVGPGKNISIILRNKYFSLSLSFLSVVSCSAIVLVLGCGCGCSCGCGCCFVLVIIIFYVQIALLGCFFSYWVETEWWNEMPSDGIIQSQIAGFRFLFCIVLFSMMSDACRFFLKGRGDMSEGIQLRD